VYVTEVVAEQVKFLEPKTKSTLTDDAQDIQPFDNPFDT
jgi:hypothetical protein